MLTLNLFKLIRVYSIGLHPNLWPKNQYKHFLVFCNSVFSLNFLFYKLVYTFASLISNSIYTYSRKKEKEISSYKIMPNTTSPNKNTLFPGQEPRGQMSKCRQAWLFPKAVKRICSMILCWILLAFWQTLAFPGLCCISPITALILMWCSVCVCLLRILPFW